VRRLPGVLLALAVLGLAACANGTGSAAGSAAPRGSPAGEPSDAPAPALATSSTRPPVDPTAVLVQFGRQGGIMGVNDQLTVRGDGGYTVTRTRPAVHKSGTLRAADLAEVRTVLQQSNFANLPKVQPAKGADLFTYQVIYGGDQILAVDGGIDERLKPVIGTLSGLMAKYSG